jgi:hypothetical protein
VDLYNHSPIRLHDVVLNQAQGPFYLLLHVYKGKVIPVFNYAPRHEGIWGSGGIAQTLLTSGLDGGEWSASRSGHFSPGKKAPGTHWKGGWVGPRGCLDAVEKRKSLVPTRNQTYVPPSFSPKRSRYTDLSIPEPSLHVHII